GPDLEEAQVVVIAAARRSHEGGAHPLRALQLLAPEDAVVEVGGRVRVADPQDGVVEAGDVEHRAVSSAAERRHRSMSRLVADATSLAQAAKGSAVHREL